jgi:hypothetical protein
MALKKPKRTGRPPEFRRRRRLVVYLEQTDAKRLQKAARAERVSASKLARTLVIEGLAQKEDSKR